MAPKTQSDITSELLDLIKRSPDELARGIAKRMMDGVRLLSNTLVSLTGAASTSLIVVPDGYALQVVDLLIEGVTAQTDAGKAATLKVGTASSYDELLNGSTGHVFDVDTATSLIAANKVASMNQLYPGTVNMSTTGITRQFAAGTELFANVSTANLVTGAVNVGILGMLIPTPEVV